jgi:hypothetical protein
MLAPVMSTLVLAADGGIPGGIATVISALLAAFIGVASLAFNSAKATATGGATSTARPTSSR